MISQPQLLTDPFLQLPTENSIRVVWFTEFPGSRHTVTFGYDLDKIVSANTIKLSRTREDQKSKFGEQTEENQVYQKPVVRDIWRHEAEITNLIPGKRVPYRVKSEREDGKIVSSEIFTLAAKPLPGTALKILLTSDHQLKPMTAANLQKLTETIGVVDAVFFAGDLVNVPDRASEWFDDNRGNAFFPCLQGKAKSELEKNGTFTIYKGGEIIQHAPIFPAIGNHEVMGKFSLESSLSEQFYDAFPQELAKQMYQDKAEIPEELWLKDYSFNTDTYQEIFTLPNDSFGGEKYYAITIGDVRLVVLFAACAWRSPSLASSIKGKYRECDRDLNNPINWGYGQHIFEPIHQGSPQYQWLEKELNSPEFKQAKYKVVMLHHPPHSLGDNVVPPFTYPVQIIDRDGDGTIKSIHYQYPKEKDYLIRDIEPLLNAAKVQLVLFGHSHLWNRFINSSGVNFLETSNVGNSYGAALGNNKRPVPINNSENYAATGDPNGLDPILPTIAPLVDESDRPMPYIASNDITVFSILDTANGTVSSYCFDTREPNSQVIKFDEFYILI
ncbi:metallophosphoesterase [Aerosakkonemataceae cyanobacterium BLCC-F50]|uniref:Metallophosphoesterase n=1 Tax=Floridaenema flaviceps BLCC-F50 TaxID=3153642 RepID=A0ABV4Y1N6_9CYAN